MSTLISLLYGSTATKALSNDELVEILRTSRVNNHRLGITGILLYRDRNFLQVLEGEQEAVNSLFEVIKKDDRHRDVMKFAARPITKPQFGEWEMGFTDLDDMDLTQIDGFSPYLNEPLNSTRFADVGFASVFLNIFKTSFR